MRAWWLAALVTMTVLSGCAQSDPSDDGGDTAVVQDVGDIEVPEDADLEAVNGSKIVRFAKAALPFTHTFKVPEGATMVRFVADPLDASSISVSMSNAETGRRRCNQQPVVGFGQGFMGARSCSSLAAIDPPGTEWSVSASGSGNADIRIEFLNFPPDGPAASLNLQNLSHAVHDLRPTQGQYVPSFDGTRLWVEWTLPEGEGPWPAVIASSPYNGETGRLGQPGGEPAMWTYWTQDWAKRGYAAINVDVRGYGLSEGCVEVWGENEQRDQAFIVDWVADQPWSNERVGFYGQSYVGTTPVAAAVQAPEALKAIIAVAPVINSYEDWHYGGVPNGESAGSPVAYQVLTAMPAPPDGQRTDLASLIAQSTSGVCDPSLLPRANDPRAVYNEFYEERDFKKRVGNVEAAVLFTEGFEDANVKSAMIPGWFNGIQSPKLGVFGHWLHQHPARLDAEVLFLGWMDHYVKGVDIGFDDFPDAVISAEGDLHRTADAWPPVDREDRSLYADFSAGTLSAEGGSGSYMIDVNPAPGSPATATNDVAHLSMKVEEPLPLVAPELVVTGTLYEENAFLHATLTEERSDGSQRTLTWGRINLALRNGYESYEPVTPGAQIEATLPFRPTEHMVEAGSTLHLTIRSVQAGEAVGLAQPQPGVFTMEGAGTYLKMPHLTIDDYEAMPITAVP